MSLVAGVMKPGFHQGACLVGLAAGQSGMLPRSSCLFTAHPQHSSIMLRSLDLASAGHRICVDFFFLFLIEGQGRMGRECSSVNYINEDLVLVLIP